jgi:hypothetical protein
LPAESGLSLQTLESLVGQWTDLRKEVAAEQRQWERQQKALAREMDVLKREIAFRQQELEKAKTRRGTREEQMEGLRNEKQELNEALDAFEPLLREAEARLRELWKRVPDSLKEKGAPMIAKFPMEGRENELRLVDRIQSVFTLMAEIERLQMEAHVVKEMVNTGGSASRQVDVIYLGLARGFAVSMSADWAGVGVPGTQGWKWTALPEEYIPAVRSAVKTLRNEQTAELVNVPLAVEEVGP